MRLWLNFCRDGLLYASPVELADLRLLVEQSQ